MSSAGRVSAATYARRIERMWAVRSDRPVVLSQRDWALICDWHARGIPLELIQEAVDASSRTRRGAKRRAAPPRSLTYIGPAVEEGWRTILDGRAGGAVAGGAAAAAEEPAEAWRRCLAAQAVDTDLASLLRERLSELASGTPPTEVDARLEQELPDRVDAALRRAAEAEIERRLSGYRGRMSGEELARTGRRALVEQLRRSLRLPRLIGS